ncbi:MAG: 2-oxoglutarate dehydrogenase E1 component [Gemmatimonadaceae bacterium]
MTGLPITGVFNDGYVAQQYEQFRRDPTSVDESWRQFFRFAESLGGGAAAPRDGAFLRKVAGAATLLAAIREYGHFAAQLDPLGSPPPGAAELTPAFHGISEADLQDVPASALAAAGVRAEASHGGEAAGTAADVVARLRELYCGTIGYEFEHLGDEAEREWFRRTIESGAASERLTPEEARAILERLTEVDGLERFLGLAFVNAKRFSIEGVDALVPMMDEAIARAGAAGTRHIVIAMAHRGRLNVLTHILGKPYAALFQEFAGLHHETNAESETGDVKYHLGYRTRRELAGGAVVDVQLVPNPSHLEFVNPVLMGVARALQRVGGNGAGPRAAEGARVSRDENAVLAICVHGDAAFPGEGVVAETLNLAQLRGYRVGGTLHVIANNQVGFTTDPVDGRSTHYASDLAKGFEIPVVHVNADDLEGCIRAVRLGIAYRLRFKRDFVIDLVGYRRHGHNETDQPSFTQPKLYDVIKTHPTPREVWAARLVRERVVTEDEVAALDKAVTERLTKIHEQSLKDGADERDEGGGEAAPTPPAETAVRAEQLAALNEQMLAWPQSFKLHPTLQRTLPRRREALSSGGIDWGHAEALAFASLLVEGINVRLTGQDAERGTFSHRQAVLHEVATGATYTPLAALPQATGEFEIYNSPLSETAAMGFEYGFSVAAPGDLVLWEAQFGDFANVAQPIIDQFIAADRAKWGQDSGLVLLLPHGYEGQGPEHSSARLERFLQLCAEGNMTVAYPSTPAQYFHIIRRHMKCPERRPLILMQPKSLLRLPQAASRLEDLSDGTFQPVLDDSAAGSIGREAVRRLVFCTGKIYYDLAGARTETSERGGRRSDGGGTAGSRSGKAAANTGVAIVRVEQLYPWPHDHVAAVLDRYPAVDEVVWAQEEPKNMGAWTHVALRLRVSTGNALGVRYIGRPERASPAEGYKNTHDVEQARIIQEVLAPATTGDAKRPSAV